MCVDFANSRDPIEAQGQALFHVLAQVQVCGNARALARNLDARGNSTQLAAKGVWQKEIGKRRMGK